MSDQPTSPFVALVIDREANPPLGKFDVYVVNPTDTKYQDVRMLSGGSFGYEDGYVETKKVYEAKGELRASSFTAIDSSDLDEMYDMTIWYYVDLVRGGDEPPEMYRFTLPKYAAGCDAPQLLPILGKLGTRIEFQKRDEPTPLERLVPTMDMDGKYTKFGT
jgi:hypothetical protein